MTTLEETPLPVLEACPLEEEALLLDERLDRYVRHRLWQLDRKFLDVEDAGDIKNSSWLNALKQPAFRLGCTGVRVTYLRTTAHRHILNLIRKDEQRAVGLKRSWDKAMNGWCVVHARDVWDHIAFLFGAEVGKSMANNGWPMAILGQFCAGKNWAASTGVESAGKFADRTSHLPGTGAHLVRWYSRIRTVLLPTRLPSPTSEVSPRALVPT